MSAAHISLMIILEACISKFKSPSSHACAYVCVCVSPPYPFYLFQFQTLLPFKCNDLFVAEGLRALCATEEAASGESAPITLRVVVSWCLLMKTSNRTARRLELVQLPPQKHPGLASWSRPSTRIHPRHLLGSNDPSPAIQVTDFIPQHIGEVREPTRNFMG